MAKPTSPVFDSGLSRMSGIVWAIPFVEGAGTSVADYSGNSNDGTVGGSGSTWGTDGTHGAYLDNSHTSYVTIANSATIQAMGGSGSVGLFVKCPTVGGGDWIITVGTTGGMVYLETDATGAARATYDDGSAANGSFAGSWQDNAWVFIHITWDGTTVRVYEDGSEVDNFAQSGTLTLSGDVNIAARYDGGRINDCHFLDSKGWNRALSAAEVSAEVADVWEAYNASASYTPDLDDSGFPAIPSSGYTDYYVDPTGGSDSNNGLTEGAAKATIVAALGAATQGTKYRILLKRGEDFTAEGRIVLRDHYGQDADNPAIVATYGTGDRPILLGFWQYHVDAELKWMSFYDLNFQEASDSGNGYLIRILGSTATGGIRGLYWQNCRFAGGDGGITVQGSNAEIHDITLFRCMLTGSSSTSSHSQGMYASHVAGLNIIECFNMSNGWVDGVAAATIFNHAYYIDASCTDVVFSKNFTYNPSSHGVQQRAAGRCEDNFFHKCPVGFQFGFDSGYGPEGEMVGYARRNVCLDSRDIAALSRGIGASMQNMTGGEMRYNIMAHQDTGTGNERCIFLNSYDTFNGMQGFRIEDNIAFKWAAVFCTSVVTDVWSGNTFKRNDIQPYANGQIWYADTAEPESGFDSADNVFWSTITEADRYDSDGSLANLAAWQSTYGDTGTTESAVSYTDPDKKLTNYAAGIGMADDAELLAAALLMEKGNWDLNLTPDRINAYFRANFDMIPAPLSFTATKSGVDVDLEATSYAPESDSFVFQRSPNGVDTWTQIATPTSPSATDLNPGPGTWYYRCATVVNSVTGDWSDVVSVTFAAPGASSGRKPLGRKPGRLL